LLKLSPGLSFPIYIFNNNIALPFLKWILVELVVLVGLLHVPAWRVCKRSLIISLVEFLKVCLGDAGKHSRRRLVAARDHLSEIELGRVRAQKLRRWQVLLSNPVILKHKRALVYHLRLLLMLLITNFGKKPDSHMLTVIALVVTVR
jgi:hypothetical protein